MIPIKIDKKILLPVSFLIVAAVAIYFGLQSRRLSLEFKNQKNNLDKNSKEIVEITRGYDKIQKDYAKLSKDYQALVSERDNALVRLKGLLAESELKKVLETTLANTRRDMQLLEKARQDALEQNLTLKEEAKDLQTIQKQLIREKEQLQKHLEQERQKSGMKKLEDENASLKSLNKTIEAGFKQKEIEAARFKDSDSKSKEEALTLSKRINELTKSYAEAVKKNKDLEERVTRLPSKFAEVARQNKVLMKRTANMHYNMGVFYTQQKEYARATAEFEKAVELAPDDAYSHFNLGYIYAEYMVNRPKAIEHFKQYLRFSKKEDRDVDWVRKYIITWESLDAKRPME